MSKRHILFTESSVMVLLLVIAGEEKPGFEEKLLSKMWEA